MEDRPGCVRGPDDLGKTFPKYCSPAAGDRKELEEKMTRKEWEAVDRARNILGLGEQATLADIKKMYHRLSRKHHPDTRDEQLESDQDTMYKLTEAYTLLMRYCDLYRFPLVPPEGHIYDAEDWWMDRFGQDPLWGRKR